MRRAPASSAATAQPALTCTFSSPKSPTNTATSAPSDSSAASLQAKAVWGGQRKFRNGKARACAECPLHVPGPQPDKPAAKQLMGRRSVENVIRSGSKRACGMQSSDPAVGSVAHLSASHWLWTSPTTASLMLGAACCAAAAAARLAAAICCCRATGEPGGGARRTGGGHRAGTESPAARRSGFAGEAAMDLRRGATAGQAAGSSTGSRAVAPAMLL